MQLNDLRAAYDQYCETGIGDEALLHEAMILLEAEIAKLAEERRTNASLRLHVESLRQSVLNVFDRPLEYQVAPIDTTAPSLADLLRHINLRMP